MSEFLLSYLLNSLWQVPLVFLCGWLAARLLRPLGPVAEHRVWVGTLLLESLLPACSFSMEPLRSLFAFWTGSAHQPHGATVSTTMGPGFAFASLHLPALLLGGVATAYGLFLVSVLVRFVWRVLAVSTLRRNTTSYPLSTEDEGFWHCCCDYFGIETAVIAASNRVGSPVTLGLWRKLILLPAWMSGSLRRADLQTVLAHECAHIKRQDFAKNLLYEFLSLPVSYHPFAWLTRTRLTHTREIVCDQLAADLTGRREYGRSLLRLASLLAIARPPTALHVIGVGMFDAHTFERRLIMLTEQPLTCRGVRRALTLAACAAITLATCTTALALHVSVGPAAMLAASSSSEPPSRSVKASSAVMQGNLLTRVNPVYPSEAKEAKIQGAVVLRAIIGKDGKIENLQVVSGPKELSRSALDAVHQWTYKPYLLNGEPTEVETTITVNYSLQQ